MHQETWAGEVWGSEKSKEGIWWTAERILLAWLIPYVQRESTNQNGEKKVGNGRRYSNGKIKLLIYGRNQQREGWKSLHGDYGSGHIQTCRNRRTGLTKKYLRKDYQLFEKRVQNGVYKEVTKTHHSR